MFIRMYAQQTDNTINLCTYYKIMCILKTLFNIVEDRFNFFFNFDVCVV